jgi:TetR/AcrR family transcriptional regulator
MGIAERKEREKEYRKESILDAAQKVFFDKGLRLSTMDEIAETAELAKGTLYLYYHSKEDLYLAVLMRGLLILRSMFVEIITQSTPVIPTMVALYQSYTEFYRRYPNYFRMMHFFNTPQFHKQVSEEMMSSCDTINQSLWGMVVQVITGGVADGKIRNDLDPIEMALIMWSTATTLLMRIDNQHELYKEKMHIDLNNTLNVSNMLLLEAVLTEQGRKELRAILNQSRGMHEPE